MTQINSKLILASKNTVTGDILYTFVWTYPRIILSEINTHRMLSRNTSSSRAIPSKRQRAKVLNDPFTPNSIGSSKKGMQAGDELTGFKRALATRIWNGARYPAVFSAWALDMLGVHKQVSNRLVEPWTWTEQVVSATDLDNLLLLRAHEMAEPHFQQLAYQVKQQVIDVKTAFELPALLGSRIVSHGSLRGSIVMRVNPGDWHLPFIDKDERSSTSKIVSAARCARVSYNLPDTGKPSTLEDDIRLFERLTASNPKHLSPVEHQAQAMSESKYFANFKGWQQFRKELE